jgi:hypothetical protein
VTISDEQRRVSSQTRNEMKQYNVAARREERLPRRQTVAGLNDKLQACSELLLWYIPKWLKAV